MPISELLQWRQRTLNPEPIGVDNEGHVACSGPAVDVARSSSGGSKLYPHQPAQGLLCQLLTLIVDLDSSVPTAWAAPIWPNVLQ